MKNGVMDINEVRERIEMSMVKKDILYELTPENKKFLAMGKGTFEAILSGRGNEENTILYGWLAKFFGTEKNASKNITFVLLVLMLGIYVGLVFWVSEENVKSQAFLINLFGKLLPFLTLAFGYMFGKQ